VKDCIEWLWDVEENAQFQRLSNHPAIPTPGARAAAAVTAKVDFFMKLRRELPMLETFGFEDSEFGSSGFDDS
jgi:hypothetical protein